MFRIERKTTHLSSSRDPLPTVTSASAGDGCFGGRPITVTVIVSRARSGADVFAPTCTPGSRATRPRRAFCAHIRAPRRILEGDASSQQFGSTSSVLVANVFRLTPRSSIVANGDCLRRPRGAFCCLRSGGRAVETVEVLLLQGLSSPYSRCQLNEQLTSTVEARQIVVLRPLL